MQQKRNVTERRLFKLMMGVERCKFFGNFSTQELPQKYEQKKLTMYRGDMLAHFLFYVLCFSSVIIETTFIFSECLRQIFCFSFKLLLFWEHDLSFGSNSSQIKPLLTGITFLRDVQNVLFPRISTLCSDLYIQKK